MDHETVFTLEAMRSSSGRGPWRTPAGSSSGSGVERTLLVTDPGVAATGHPDRVKEAIESEGMEVVVYDRSRVERLQDLTLILRASM